MSKITNAALTRSSEFNDLILGMAQESSAGNGG